MKAGTRSTACLALVRAFCPGAAASLRECRSVEWSSATFSGERIAIEFDLGDGASRRRAFQLAGFASDASAADIPVRGWMFTEIAAQVRGDVLRVHAQALRDDHGGRK